MSYDLLLNLGLKTCREANIIEVLLFYQFHSIIVYLSFSNFGLFKFV